MSKKIKEEKKTKKTKEEVTPQNTKKEKKITKTKKESTSKKSVESFSSPEEKQTKTKTTKKTTSKTKTTKTITKKSAEKKVKETKPKTTKKTTSKPKTTKTKKETKKSDSQKNKPEKENQKNALQSEINIGMIGHVDHGKTSLTRAISAKWCDTHSEELKRGISIRLGYADVTFYKLDTHNGVIYSNKPEYLGQKAEVISKRNVSFVDAPGHETLMTTMLSGAALMNGAVLVIAANEECPQPRTIEHLMALKFAGIKKIVVAQNKIDLVTKEKAKKNYDSIKNFLKKFGYENVPIIPTAATFNVNIDSLIKAIETNIPTPEFDETKPLKMFIARSFDINKPGTTPTKLKGAIIGGSITQGVIKVGDLVELNPGLKGKTLFKVQTISTSNGLVDKARAGGLIAIGTDMDPSVAQNDQLRGQIASTPGTISLPVKEIQVKTTMFERTIISSPQLKNKPVTKTQNTSGLIKLNEPLVLTIGTHTNIGFVTKVSSENINLNLKNESIAEKGEKVALSKNIEGQWRLVAYGEII